MVRALVLAAGLALAGCGTYTVPATYSWGEPMMNNGRQMQEVRCCTFLGMRTGGPIPGRRSRMGAGFWAGHGLAAPPR